MSWSTTVAKILSVIDGVSGVDNVYETPLTKTSRAAAEAARGVTTSGAATLQSWEVSIQPRPTHHGAGGYLETEAVVEVVAHYRHDEDVGSSVPSLRTFRELLAAVGEALLDPTSGLPQIRDSVIVPVEVPDRPVRLPTGQSAWRASFRFELWDVSST